MPALKPRIPSCAPTALQRARYRVRLYRTGRADVGRHRRRQAGRGARSAASPQVQAFVDEEAGPDVAEKVRRRLQHFIDRKIAALFEPLVALQTGRGADRPRPRLRLPAGRGAGRPAARRASPNEVKALDQEARGALRKHGIRFGQYTIFLPALLKPAPTRLRLVLWSLSNGAGRVPRKPAARPGDDPERRGHARGLSTRCRAITAPATGRSASTCWNVWPTMLRGQDSRGGFEATADMLSITGMTLEQFADLMEGLGYKAEKGERPKAKPRRSGEEGRAGRCVRGRCDRRTPAKRRRPSRVRKRRPTAAAEPGAEAPVPPKSRRSPMPARRPMSRPRRSPGPKVRPRQNSAPAEEAKPAAVAPAEADAGASEAQAGAPADATRMKPRPRRGLARRGIR